MPSEQLTGFSDHEVKVASRLFCRDGRTHDSTIGGSIAVDVLLESGLSKRVLHDIWEIVDAGNKGAVIFQEFCLLCRLIMHVRCGEPLSEQLLSRIAPSAGIEWADTGSTIHFPLAIPLSIVEKYIKSFHSAGVASTGQIHGEQFKLLLTQSELSIQDLGRVWSLADVGNDGLLNMGEFIVAMFLIGFREQGFDIPAQLTSGLMSIATASASALCSLVVSNDSAEAVDLISDRTTSSLQDLYGLVYDSHHRASKREIELRLARRRYERAVERRSALCARRQGIKASLDNLQAQSILVQAQIDDLVAETAFLKSSSARKGSFQGLQEANGHASGEWLRRDIASLEHLRHISVRHIRDKQLAHNNALVALEQRRQADQSRQISSQITIGVRGKLNELRKARVAMHLERFELAQCVSKYTHSQHSEPLSMHSERQ